MQLRWVDDLDLDFDSDPHRNAFGFRFALFHGETVAANIGENWSFASCQRRAICTTSSALAHRFRGRTSEKFAHGKRPAAMLSA
jgi:hypothetical protein